MGLIVAFISDDDQAAASTSCGLLRIPERTATGSPNVRRCRRDVHSPNADRTMSTYVATTWARRFESSERVSARPRPRARSRVN